MKSKYKNERLYYLEPNVKKVHFVVSLLSDESDERTRVQIQQQKFLCFLDEFGTKGKTDLKRILYNTPESEEIDRMKKMYAAVDKCHSYLATYFEGLVQAFQDITEGPCYKDFFIFGNNRHSLGLIGYVMAASSHRFLPSTSSKSTDQNK